MTLLKKKSNEELICDIQFNLHKFTSREKPVDPKKILIISCFSEFGCEVMGAMYCIPRLIQDIKNEYVIVVGWYGRAYLYKHLVDEFWEVKEDFQFLRDKAMAFHHVSRNLAKLEKNLSKLGQFISSDKLGRIAVGNSCQCGNFWGQTENVVNCPKCSSTNLIKSLFADVKYWKPRVVPIPIPSEQKMKEAEKYKGNVGIIARNRTTYGRNLQPEFYVKLIKKLEEMGYKPIWLGEKQSTLPCPVEHITDFSRMPESRDLELTLAIVKNLTFTVQFWTASTRLSAIMGVPYLIFESPDQLFGQGQEAYRMALTTFGKKKLALCHFLKVYNDNDTAIQLVERCVKEMQQGNWHDVIGMVDEPEIVVRTRQQNLYRLAGL